MQNYDKELKRESQFDKIMINISLKSKITKLF